MKFLKSILSKDQPESAKRFFGGIGFIVAIVYIGFFAHDLINQLLFTSATLIGLGILDKKDENK